ncbi:TonB-dependent receptor [Pedobacter duraquae]|uniref:TonB-dependent receptor-like protein n=1 Tax=Pedobacter duraquae TaxID=425511 RepID=A0A4R6IF73_9SPHI|nr:carboxypeptidase-like regulatory domain-containing protein [Pedobacter duraquae]TDO20983.1 TonB-dependent receptor-like protein [Pedobacter duraquae]
MKTILLSFLLILTLGGAQAQTRISGFIKTPKGKAVANASISIKNSYDGASSDSTGHFDFTTFEKGKQVLVFSALNFDKDSVQLVVEGKLMNLNLLMKDAINELETVTISAGTYTTGDAKKGAVLGSIDIATLAGSRADVIAAMQTLPGAQAAGSESGLFVRGGTAAETKTYFDGMLVKSPFNATVPDQASRGRLSPFLFKGTSFSSGGYSAQYGQALSSALVLESTDLPDKTTTGITLLSVGGGVDQNIRYKNSALILGGYYYNLAPAYSVFKQQQNNFIKAPEQGGGSIQYKAKTSNSGMFKFYAAYGVAQLSLNSPNINVPSSPSYFSNANNNIYVNSTYKAYLNASWKLEAGISYNRDQDQGLMVQNNYKRTDKLLEGRATLTHYYGRLSNVKFGAETFNTGRAESLNNLGRSYTDQLSAAFAESDIFLSSKVVTRIGLRTEYSSYLNRYNVAPRLSLGYKTGKDSQLSFAYGRFYQNPEDSYLILKALDYEQADHYILKYELNLADRLFRIEGYYKDYANLTKVKGNQLDNSGSGYARGFELFLKDKKTIPNGDFWISYSFLDSKRDFANYPMLATPAFAAKHTASLVAKQFIPAISSQIGATYVFASGRTYVNPNNPVYLGDKTKSTNNLSLSLSYLTHVFKQFSVLYVNASNVAGFKNIYGYQYSTDGQNRRAIQPSSRRDIIIGLIMTIGDDNFVR